MGVRKKIRCYTKCNVAIQALQRMKPDTIVISIGDAVTNDEQPPPTPPKTPKSPVMSPQEQLLIKKPKLIKKHRMKNMQNQLFQNPVASGSTSNRAGGVRGPMIPGTARPRHKRVNIFITNKVPLNGAPIPILLPPFFAPITYCPYPKLTLYPHLNPIFPLFFVCDSRFHLHEIPFPSFKSYLFIYIQDCI